MIDIKGVILAGGKGTRLLPLTDVIHKPILPVGKQPMICHSVIQLVGANIFNIMVVCNEHNISEITRVLGGGKLFGCKFTYTVQEEPLGIAHALLQAEEFANGHRLVVLLSDNIFEYPIKQYVDRFRQQRAGARVLLTEVEHPHQFGIAEIEDNRIINIEEKPTFPKGNYAVLGAYFYDEHVFDIIHNLTMSYRGEYEVTDVNNEYCSRGLLEHDFIQGKWFDAGTFRSWLAANTLLLKQEYLLW